MLSAKPEMVWQGRIHVGDEPGIYGDANYAGLSTEFPMTFTKTNPTGPNTTTLVLHTNDVQMFTGYPGHLLTVNLYREDPAQQFHWLETVLTTTRMTSADNNSKEITLNLAGHTSPYFVSLRVRVDTEVTPGLYDDFIVRRLDNRSENFTFVASFGFTL